MAKTCPPVNSTAPDSSSDDAAHLFNLASNPIRLRILTSLVHGARSIDQIAEEMERDRRLIAQYLNHLTRSNLVRCTRQGRRRVYAPTESGRKLVQAAGILSGTKAPRQEADSSPVAAPSAEAPTPSPMRADALSHLVDVLKALAEPVRLRLLNLLAGRHEVCVCHLHETLELPQSTVSRHLTVLRRAGLIVGRRHGTWVYYRLANPAQDLGRLTAGYFDQGLCHCSVLADDSRRLDRLAPCSDRPPPD